MLKGKRLRRERMAAARALVVRERCDYAVANDPTSLPGDALTERAIEIEWPELAGRGRR